MIGEVRLYFMHLLNKRDYTAAELTNKAMVRKYPGSEIKEALSVLLSDNIVNDFRYAANLAETYSGKKGKRYFEMKLKQHLLPASIVASQLESFEEFYSKESTRRLAEKYKVASFTELSYPEKAKVLNYLARQGFSNPSQIFQQISNNI